MKAPQLKTYLVYIGQVNQTRIVVRARNRSDAGKKGYDKWRREDGHSLVIAVEEAAPEFQGETS